MKDTVDILEPFSEKAIEEGKTETLQNAICKKIDAAICCRKVDRQRGFLYSFKLLDSDYYCVKNEGTECEAIWIKVLVKKFKAEHCDGDSTEEKIWMPHCIIG